MGAIILTYLAWYFLLGAVMYLVALAFYRHSMWDSNDTGLDKTMDSVLFSILWPLVLYIMIRDLIEYVHEWSKKGGEDE